MGKKTKIFLCIAVCLLPFASVRAETGVCPSSIEGYSDAQLQQLLTVCEQEIADRQGKLELTQKQATTIESIIQQLKYKIEQSQLKIKASNIKIVQLGDEITVRNKNINALSAKMERIRESLGEIMRKTDEATSINPVVAILSSEGLSDFFVNLDDYDVVNGRLRKTIVELNDVKTETESEKAKLEESKIDESAQKYLQEQEKSKTESYRKEQEKVLSLTKNQAEAYKKEIASKERIKNDIRNRIFKTVGGQELRFEDAARARDLMRYYQNLELLKSDPTQM